MPSDLEVAQMIALKPITAIAGDLGLTEDELHPCGRHQAKVDLSVLNRLSDRLNGKYIDVTALSPTPLGETILIPTALAV